MALSASVLSAAMRAAILAKGPSTGAQNNAGLTDLCDAIAASIVSHITSAAVVTVAAPIPVLVAVPAGTGGTTAPGTGTIT